MTADSEPEGPGGVDRAADERGIDRIAETLRAVGTDSTADVEGVFSERIGEIEPLLLSFGEALGGEPSRIEELPFTEEAGTDGMPEPLYVRHDTEMLDQLTTWLLQGQHVALVSPFGTGKTAVREIARRDLGGRSDFVVTAVRNAAETTPRGLFERLLRSGYDAGYEIDTDDYWQVAEGVPWATDETRDAVGRMARRIAEDDATPLLIVDEIEDLPAELLGPLQTAADGGVRLFLSGTPEGKDRLEEFRETLSSRLRYYEGIDTFSPADVEEYVARSLAYFRGESYEGQAQSLFANAAIMDVYERTDGNPRAVRLECQDLFARAAFVWDRSDAAAERIRITPALRNRDLVKSR